ILADPTELDKLAKSKLEETIGWVAWCEPEYDKDYPPKHIPDKNKVAVYVYNPFYGFGKDLRLEWIPQPDIYLLDIAGKEVDQFWPGQRIKFSGGLEVDKSSSVGSPSVTNPKYTFLADDPPVPTPSADELKDLRVTLDRTGCFGTCPDYTLTVEADGK